MIDAAYASGTTTAGWGEDTSFGVICFFPPPLLISSSFNSFSLYTMKSLSRVSEDSLRCLEKKVLSLSDRSVSSPIDDPLRKADTAPESHSSSRSTRQQQQQQKQEERKRSVLSFSRDMVSEDKKMSTTHTRR